MSDVDAQIRKTVRQIVREEMRAKVNPTPGGPFGTVYVNAQGQVIKAEAAGGGWEPLVYKLPASALYVTPSLTGGTVENVIEWGAPDYDPQETITYSSGVWDFYAPYDGLFRVEMGIEFGTRSWEDGDDVYMFLVGAGASWPTMADWNLFYAANVATFYLRASQTVQRTAGQTITPKYGFQTVSASGTVRIDFDWIAIDGAPTA